MAYREKNGKWRGVKIIDYEKRTKTFKTERQAIRWEEDQTVELWKTEQENISYPSLAEWSVEYLEYAEEKFVPKTLKEEKVPAFNRLFEFVSSALTVDRLSVADCQRMLMTQAKHRSGNAANKDRKNLLAAWNWGIKVLKLPKDNPFADVDLFPVEQQPKYVPPFEDFWKTHAVARPKDQVFLLTMLHTAARRGELLKLKWDDVDLDNGKIRLWTRKRTGGKEYDWLPLTKRLRRELEEHFKDRTSELVFCRSDGSPYKWRQHLMKILCERAGVKHFTFHAIRHLTASLMAEGGKDMAKIQAILRHKNLMTTTIYIHRLGIMENDLEDIFGEDEE
ncbi:MULTISPECIES: site-specific integrase [unclassified Pseudodesulfovibrio]|uniref:tyrosine-type recombinase/integrase n=1 Tax=unclassified Pseudodesulfovibrio TaxID=2661612 RepID=UPI000FEBDA8B|nr:MULTISPECIES: site-specific integrase [unclassified Pseudodesulfovibrio]MCJ2165226.1 site-specific integrase [Pseudodesulfovibrio sp. S3-i]RWU03280.1 site-specific integrase [Pseudodesulfovibrio sp. S3]